jgi:hypothetical protein
MRGAPISPQEYAAGDGLAAWEQIGKAYEWYLSEGERRGDVHPDGLDNAQMWSLQEAIKAQARRGDAVEAWIKRHRDEYQSGHSDWIAMDALLDDYRAHADTGTPLNEDVQGSQGEGS